jgi:uncharacterized DUF497 family protein
MRFDWDEAKRRSNIRKHRIDFVGVEKVFANETVTLRDDRFDTGENRFLTFGFLNGRIVTVTHTETDEVTRIISVRKASKNEEEIYFKGLRNW